MDGVDVRDLLVSRVDLAVVEGADAHHDADVVVTLLIRVGGVRGHPCQVRGERRRKFVGGMDQLQKHVLRILLGYSYSG